MPLLQVKRKLLNLSAMTAELQALFDALAQEFAIQQ
jgi:hypothetical protein